MKIGFWSVSVEWLFGYVVFKKSVREESTIKTVKSLILDPIFRKRLKSVNLMPVRKQGTGDIQDMIRGELYWVKAFEKWPWEQSLESGLITC